MDGVKINGKHTSTDYHMFLTDAIVISSPEPKTQYVEIPGADGALDLTEADGNGVRYKMRTITIPLALDTAANPTMMRTILTDIHGKHVEIILDSDPDHYFTGRAVVEFSEQTKSSVRVAITATVQPYALDVQEYERGIAFIPQSFTTLTEAIAGRDVALSSQNTDLRIGTPDVPGLNASRFSNVVLSWADAEYAGASGTITFYDASGAHYDQDFETEGEVTSAVTVSVPTIASEGVDTTKIWRIAVSGVKGGSIVGVAVMAKATISNGAMPVVPKINFMGVPSGFAVSLNGVYKPLGAGDTYDPELVLLPGSNVASFYASSPNAALGSFTFRRGVL